MAIIDAYLVVLLPYKILTLRSIPQLWRLVSTFLITGPKLGMIFDPYFLFTYAGQLETESVKFSQPGDFFVYLVFVCVVILVSRLAPFLRFFSSLFHPFSLIFHYLVNLPGQPLVAVTVPGNEEDCPRVVRPPIIRKSVSGGLAGRGRGGIPN